MNKYEYYIETYATVESDVNVKEELEELLNGPKTRHVVNGISFTLQNSVNTLVLQRVLLLKGERFIIFASTDEFTRGYMHLDDIPGCNLVGIGWKIANGNLTLNVPEPKYSFSDKEGRALVEASEALVLELKRRKVL